MKKHLKDFWGEFQNGIQVAVAGRLPDKLAGVREGFRRYFHEGLASPVSVSVLSRLDDELAAPLPRSDEQILHLARDRAERMRTANEEEIHFFVGTESGLMSMEVDGDLRHFVRSWTVVFGVGDEAWGSSGAIQIPVPLIEGIGEDDISLVIPGTRRSGGMLSSLTGRLETRRSATALSTVHALSSLMYGLLGDRSSRSPSRR